MSFLHCEYNQNEEKQIGNYILIKEIGSGGFAKVYQSLHIPTGEKVAIKVLNKLLFQEGSLNSKRLQREISILKIVKHKNIIKLYEVMETPQKIYLVMELCEKGELFEYISSRKKLDEVIALKFFHQIVNAINYLHKQNIVHRDLKPENMLLDENYELKIIDFGISATYSDLLSTPCGTVVYAPPEMHYGIDYNGMLSDVWSCGVVLYAMVCGYLPFNEENEDKNVENIVNGVFEIPEWVSDQCKDMIKGCLNKDPNKRFDIDKIRAHKWFNMIPPIFRGGIDVNTTIPVDDTVVKLCEKTYKVPRKKIEYSVANNIFDEYNAIYYIVLNKLRKKNGYQSISDLISEKFENFINKSFHTNSTNTTGSCENIQATTLGNNNEDKQNLSTISSTLPPKKVFPPKQRFYSSKNINVNRSVDENSIKRVYSMKKKKINLSLSSCAKSIILKYKKDSNQLIQTSSFNCTSHRNDHTTIHNRGASMFSYSSTGINKRKQSINSSLSMRNNSLHYSSSKTKKNVKHKGKLKKQPPGLSIISNNNSKIFQKKVAKVTAVILTTSNIKDNFNKKEIKIYDKSVIDFKCIFFVNIEEIIKKVMNVLTKKNVFFTRVTPYKFHCSKNGIVFDVEVFKLNLFFLNPTTTQNDTLYYLTVIAKNHTSMNSMSSYIKMFYDD